MKITNINDYLDIKVGGKTQLILGIIFTVVGIALTVVLLSGAKDSSTGEPASPWLAVAGVVFAGIGLVVMFFAKSSQILIQKGQQTTVTAKRLIGGKATQQAFPTANIVAVELVTSTEFNVGSSDNRNSGTTRKSNLSLVLNNNDTVLIDSASNGNNGVSVNGFDVNSIVQKAPLGKEAEQIAQFLGVPLRNEGPASFGETISTVVNTFKGGDQNSNPLPPVVAPPSTGTPTPPDQNINQRLP